MASAFDLHITCNSSNAYKYMEGIPDLSNLTFIDIKNCLTCPKANMQKNSAGKRSLLKSVTHS